MLNLCEELLLLALHDRKGTVVSSTSMALTYGLTGAILMELTLAGRLAIEEQKFVLIDPTPTGDDILDEALARIKSSKIYRKPGYWVSKLSGIKKIKDRLLGRLVNQGILRREEHRILRVIPSRRYPTAYSVPEMKLRERIRTVVLKGKKPDERTVVIISLVNACNLIKEIFDKEERKAAKKRIKEITESEAIGKAVSDTVAGVQAAVLATITATTVAATAYSN
ncbi:MAG: GPP34 family phosphoprotein [Candidatus Latescibacterota bacterium]